jgi:hypothetical protein
MSVVSFVLLIAELKKSRKMVKYNTHKGLIERMGVGYEVKLGLGLHMGYAIEGAIGSYYKIDASYLSPHVKMSERLEGATKKFGVPLLISGDLEAQCTRRTKGYLRQVDYVTFPGNEEPVKLFTFDCDSSRLPLEDVQPFTSQKERKIQRVHNRIKRDNLREAAFKCQVEISSTFESNKDIILMRGPYKKEFFSTYKLAFREYVRGNWDEAKELFDKTMTLAPNPEKEPVTQNLLAFMAETDYKPPAEWKGYKPFDE